MCLLNYKSFKAIIEAKIKFELLEENLTELAKNVTTNIKSIGGQYPPYPTCSL